MTPRQGMARTSMRLSCLSCKSLQCNIVSSSTGIELIRALPKDHRPQKILVSTKYSGTAVGPTVHKLYLSNNEVLHL